MKQFLSIFLIVGLTALVAFRPWHRLNQRMGVLTAMDSIRADTLSALLPDSLILSPSMAVTLPQIISDSLSYTIYARRKKKAYLEEQSALLQKENQLLDSNLKSRKKAMKERAHRPMSEDQLDEILSRQNRKDQRHSAKSLGVSDMQSELDQRDKYDKSNP